MRLSRSICSSWNVRVPVGSIESCPKPDSRMRLSGLGHDSIDPTGTRTFQLEQIDRESLIFGRAAALWTDAMQRKRTCAQPLRDRGLRELGGAAYFGIHPAVPCSELIHDACSPGFEIGGDCRDIDREIGLRFQQAG